MNTPATTTQVTTTQITTVPVTTPAPNDPAKPAFTFGATPQSTSPQSTFPQTTSTMTVTPAAPPERFVVWGGTNLNTATGGLNFGVSYPVMGLRGVKLLARGTGELGILSAANSGAPGFLLRADALASYPLGDNMLYGGPGVVASLGRVYGLGVSLGYRAHFSARLGGFIEGQLNRFWTESGGKSSPGIRTGLTYRF